MRHQTKKIKITNKGYVLTSRGMARTPIDRPYKETVDAIRLLIARFGAHVVEVLDDGREVELTINNYASDNSNIKDKVVSDETVKSATEPVKVADAQQCVPKTMSRKERKRLEYQRRMAEQYSNSQDTIETVATTEEPENTTHTTPHTDDVEITESIENTTSALDEVPVE